ncbi:MAG TPA: S8/S53 family peptidase [Candidatus Dormibacteraeota bacterium]|nr:S8/S53 family peptidase [Candidatus Dormibacteraeota bacterium]
MADHDDDDDGGRRLPVHRLPRGVAVYPPETDPDHERGAFLLRTDRLAIATEHLDRARRLLARIGVDLDVTRVRCADDRDAEEVRGASELGVSIVDVPEQQTVPDVVTFLVRRGVRSSPIHVHTLSWHILLSPATFPVPAAPPPWAESLPRETAENAVIVGVADSGAGPHPALDGILDRRSDADPTDVAPADGRLDLDAGHGTFVAGLIAARAYAGGAPQRAVRVLARRVLNSMGVVDDVGLANVIVSLAPLVDVLCLPLGGYAMQDQSSLHLDAALAQAYESNPDLVVVAAAGNQASDRVFWPATFKRVVAVATFVGGARACFSNYGQWVDCCAPGVDVVSTFPAWNGPLDTRWADVPNPGGCQFPPFDPGASGAFTGWARWSGTSFSAPVVAGAIAAQIADGTPAIAAAAMITHDPAAPTIPGIGRAVR